VFALISLRQATQTFKHHRFNHKSGNSMTKAPIATPEPPDIDQGMNVMLPKRNLPEVAAIAPAAGERELESAAAPQSGVLRELALARWRGSTLPPQGDDDENR